MKGSVAEQAQIQSQLDSMVNGEQSQIVSLRAQLTEAKYNLEQTVIRAPSNGYVTQVLIRPGTYAAALPLRPVMVFIPEQKRQIVAQFRQNSLLRLKPGDDAEVVFNALPGQVFHGKLTSILPVVPGGSYQAQGVLQSLTVVPARTVCWEQLNWTLTMISMPYPTASTPRWRFTPTISAMFR